MRRALRRAAANTAMRAEEPRTRFARWTARWFDRTPTVPGSRFQDDDEPFPGHWRTPPNRWPTVDPTDSQTQAALTDALRQLPRTWRDVVVARDVQGRDAAESSHRLGLTLEEQQAILGRARAALRAHLDRQLHGELDQ